VHVDVEPCTCNCSGAKCWGC